MGRVSQTRAHPRAPIELRVAYQRMNAFLADYTRDISKGGVFIKTTTPFPIGTEFDFHISLPKRPEGILLKGRVVWVDDGKDPEGASKGAGAGMGIQFVWARD